ncbi:MAG: O-antigen ligase family protein [Pseudonocardia sp.]
MSVEVDRFLPTRDRAPGDAVFLLCLYAAALLLVPARLVLRGIPLSISPANLVGLGLVVLWFCSQMTTNLGAAKGRNAVRFAVLTYATCLVASYGYAAWNYLPADELRQLDRRLILATALIGVSLAVCDGVRAVERLERLVRAVVVAGAGVASVGALQFVLGLDLTQLVPFPGLQFSTDDPFVSARGSLRRVAGTASNPIEFATVCATLLPLALHLGYRAQRSGQSPGRWWLCAGLIGSGLLFSVSRTAVLGLVVAGAVLMVGWSARRRVHAAVAVAGALVASKLAFPGLLGIFYGLFAYATADNSTQYRTHDYPIVIAEVKRNVLLGHGLGTWYAPKYQILDNQYLMALVETGVLGFAAFVGLFVAAIVAALRARHLARTEDSRDLCLSIAASVTVPMVASVTFDLASFPTVSGLAFLMIGVAGAALRCVGARHPKATE